MQEVWVIELTVCFETGYEAAHNLKKNQYADLIEQIDTVDHWSLWRLEAVVSSPSPVSHCLNSNYSSVLENSGRKS